MHFFTQITSYNQTENEIYLILIETFIILREHVIKLNDPKVFVGNKAPKL